MAISLGKDATVTVGTAVVGVRNVTFSSSAKTIDVQAYGVRQAYVYSVGQDATLSMELNDSASVAAMFTALVNGTQVSVSGGLAGWSFTAVVTNITETAAVDGVVTWQIECKMTMSGLKAA